MEQELYWDATYAIVLGLMHHHPDIFPEDVGLAELVDLVVNLPGFADDEALVNEQILLDIMNVWYEEETT